MRFASVLMLALTPVVALAAQEMNLTDAEKRKFIEAFKRQNLNCPKLLNMKYESMDVRGFIFRVTCEASDGTSPPWDIRVIEGVDGLHQSAEPW